MGGKYGISYEVKCVNNKARGNDLIWQVVACMLKIWVKDATGLLAVPPKRPSKVLNSLNKLRPKKVKLKKNV